MQLLTHFPLMNVILPPNAGLFFNELMKIAAFEFIDTSPYLDEWLGLDPTEPKSPNFEALGY